MNQAITAPPPAIDLGGCAGCGQCCRSFRVSFYHGEVDTQPGGWVPVDLVEAMTPFRVCMKGTASGKAACVALSPEGVCSIYPLRPSPCREFEAFLPNGERHPDCARVRASIGLA